MVFHYTIRGGQCLGKQSDIELDSSDITCYVGRDKHENEFLIKYGWPGDIWFHVDSLSSAHVYFRVTSEKAPVNGIPIDDLPEDSVYDMMQIVKNNSISGTCAFASRGMNNNQQLVPNYVSLHLVLTDDITAFHFRMQIGIHQNRLYSSL
jgi:hypothetical protein